MEKIKRNQWQSDMAEGVILAKERGIIDAKAVDTLIHSICMRAGKTNSLDDADRPHQELLQQREKRALDRELEEQFGEQRIFEVDNEEDDPNEEA